jgi:aryl-alcohol dehydrogenase-like predicted oxidoreductase
MDRRRIGSLEVSTVGVGCNNFGWTVFTHPLDQGETDRVVHAALDVGVNFFDTAESYGESEALLGQALVGRRDKAVIATKFSKARPADVRVALEGSLSRLKTDHIDLYQLHRPDPAVPVEDTLGVLGEFVAEGKVREVGCSNMSAEQLRAARTISDRGAAFVSVQNELSLMNRAAAHDVVPECERQGIAFLPYFPLGNGLLTGKYRRGKPKPIETRLASGPMAGRFSEAALDVVERLHAFAESRGHTLLELAFAWLLASPAVASVIAGVTSPAQVRANAAVSWRLTSSDLSELQQRLDM